MEAPRRVFDAEFRPEFRWLGLLLPTSILRY
jgi:hypothetical protein